MPAEAGSEHSAQPGVSLLEAPIAACPLMDAAVRYHESEDVRVLLELPEEERTIVRQVLGLEEDAEI